MHFFSLLHVCRIIVHWFHTNHFFQLIIPSDTFDWKSLLFNVQLINPCSSINLPSLRKSLTRRWWKPTLLYSVPSLYTIYKNKKNKQITRREICFKLAFLTSESVAVGAVDIIPFIVMTLKKTQSVHTILIGKVVWLIFCPVMEVSRCSIGPYKLSFCVDIRQAQPRLFSAVQTLNEHIFLLTVDTGKISPLYSACSLTETPRTAGSYFSVAISSKVEPVFFANVCVRKKYILTTLAHTRIYLSFINELC